MEKNISEEFRSYNDIFQQTKIFLFYYCRNWIFCFCQEKEFFTERKFLIFLTTSLNVKKLYVFTQWFSLWFLSCLQLYFTFSTRPRIITKAVNLFLLYSFLLLYVDYYTGNSFRYGYKIFSSFFFYFVSFFPSG